MALNPVLVFFVNWDMYTPSPTIIREQETAKDGMAGLQTGVRHCMTFKGQSQGEGFEWRSIIKVHMHAKYRIYTYYHQ